MLTHPNSDADGLTSDEMTRLDALLTWARSFHYLGLTLAGLSLTLASLEKASGLSLPWGGVVVPGPQAAVGLYLLVIVLVVGADRVFVMAYPWLALDRRRPPFAWIPLGSGPVSIVTVTWWLLVPVFTCAVATAITLDQKDYSGFGLSFVGFVMVLTPRSVGHHWRLIQERKDHGGGRATYSIYLVYWYRLVRQICLTLFFAFPVLAVVPKWRTDMLRVELVMLLALLPAFAVRLLASFGPIYRRIDRFGTRFGFPPESSHHR